MANNSTNRNSNNFTVKKSSRGLNGGAIAGIIIGCVAAILGIVAVFRICPIQKPKKFSPYSMNASVNRLNINNINNIPK